MTQTDISIWKKLNPIWWFENDDDPNPPATYMVGRPEWKRHLYWWFRNPFHNFTFYVIGVVDRSPITYGYLPRDNFLPEGTVGWKANLVHPTTGSFHQFIYLPFVRWTGPIGGWLFYLGWRTNGCLGFKFIRNRGED